MIICDLDGTLSNHMPRRHLAIQKDWDAYHARLGDDVPHLDVYAVLRAIGNGNPGAVTFATARPEAYREATVEWLRKVGLGECYMFLLMRGWGDRRPAPQCKLDMIERHFGGLPNALHYTSFILEDRQDVAHYLRSAGFNVWEVREDR